MKNSNQILDFTTSISNNTKEDILNMLKGSNEWGMVGAYMEKGYPIHYIDAQLLNYLGYTYEEFIEQVEGYYINAIHKEDRERVEKELYLQLMQNDFYDIKYRIITKNQGYTWVADKGSIAISIDGKKILTGIIMDLKLQTAKEEAYLEARESWKIVEKQTRFFQSIYQTLQSGVVQFVKEDDMNILNANDSTFELFGYTREEFATQFHNRIANIVYEEDYSYLVKTLKNIKLNETRKIEYRINTKGNVIKWLYAEVSKLLNLDGIEIMQVVYIDITELKNNEKEQARKIKDEMESDTLTNFYSKSYGQELIRQYINNKNQEEICELLVIDMDNFSVINDSYGVMFGNVLLKDVTENIKKFTKTDDILVRSGGDEFLVLLTNSGREDSFIIADSICNSVKKIYAGEKRDITISCSIGIAGTIYSDEYDELYNLAIIALEYAKQINIGGYLCYCYTINEISNETKEEYLKKHFVHEIRENNDETEQDMISFAFALLEKTKDLPSGINLLLSRIGKQYNLDRVSVSEVDLDYLSMQYIYQWSKSKDNSTMGNTFYLTKDFLARFENRYDQVTICESSEDYQLKSCLLCPIYEMGVYKGSVSFEKDIEGYNWTEDMKRLLKEISKIISTYTLKIKADSVSKAKTDFLSRMSHEIRTPMNAITGMACIAKNAIEDRKKVEDCLSKIEYSTKYLISLVNNILDMSKIESGKMTILNQSFDLKKLVKEIDVIMRPQMESKNINFKVEENYENGILLGDELRLGQVLVNILGNAVKFTEDYGEILLKIEQLKQDENGAVIRFSVKDSGIGIGEDNLGRIFNSFEQAESNIVKEYGGTGLGLSISSNLVRSMGGILDVQSTYKEGSEFFFTIHFRWGITDDITVKDDLSEDKFDFKGKRVLVVEDNSLNMEIEKSLLEMTGCIVEEATNGKEALERFETNPSKFYDLILMDIRMPIMDGLEATKLIRTSGKEDARTIPIIATTANAFDEDTKKSMESGMDGHISKPIEVKHLYEMINKILLRRG